MSKNYGQTGVASDVALGKGGPRVKNDSGVVQHRNSVDTAFARSQGATPVAGDDFTTKDYVDGKLGALPSMDAYDSAGGTAIAVAAWTDVPLGTNRQIDTAQFTHSVPAADFTWVGVSGTKVLVLGRITATVSAGATTMRGRIMVDSGAGFVEATGARASGDIAAGSEDSVYPQAILTLNNGDRVKIQADHTNATAVAALVINSSGINAAALENPAGAAAGNVARTFDNRGSPVVTGAVGPAGQADFTIAAGAGYVAQQFLRVVTATGTCANANVQFFRDSARTDEVYSALNKDPSTQYTDRNPATLMGDDGSALQSDTLYGRITKNDAGTATFEIEAVLWGES